MRTDTNVKSTARKSKADSEASDRSASEPVRMPVVTFATIRMRVTTRDNLAARSFFESVAAKDRGVSDKWSVGKIRNVPEARLELAQPCDYCALNTACLPISPLGLSEGSLTAGSPAAFRSSKNNALGLNLFKSFIVMFLSVFIKTLPLPTTD